MKFINRLTALLLAMGSCAVMAQEVSVDVAQSRAIDFFSRQEVSAMRAKRTDAPMPTLAYTSKSEGKTCFYIFNAGEDDGFVIVGGDEAAYEILGYSDHGSFDYDSAPDNFKWWLGQYTEQIAHADASIVDGPRRVQAAATRGEIEPMIKTKWDQDAPYNNKIPTYNGKIFVTGCVATAMAQMMYFYKYPSTGTGSHSYTIDAYPGVTFSANFGNTTYRWSDMKLQYSYSDTGTAADAVATLMYHVGVSVDMKYNISENGGSGASSVDIGYALANYFGYDKSMRMDYRTYFTDDQWEDFVYEELKAGRPVLYSGDSESSGHQFICDGYDSSHGMFTFNWGWGGYCDGSYLLTGTGALQPDGSGIGGAGAGKAYNRRQSIVTCVQPDCGGNEVVHFGQSADVEESIYLKIGNEEYDNYVYDRSTGSRVFYLYTSLQNFSCLTTMFDYGVKAIETTNGTTLYSTSMTNIQLGIGYRYNSAMGLMFAPFNWEAGTYELRPVVRIAGGTDDDWVEVDTLPNVGYPTITVKGEQSSASNPVYFTHEPYFNNDNNTYEDDFLLHLTFKNGTDAAASARIYYNFSTDKYIWSGYFGYSTFPANYELEDTWDIARFFDNLPSELTPGRSYTMELYTDEDHSIPYNYPSVTFTYRSKLTVDYSVGSVGWGTLILPFNSELPSGMELYGCEEVDNNGVLTLVEKSTIERNKPYIVGAKNGINTSFVGPEAINANKPSFADGILMGAVSNNVPLVAGTDYIMQNHNGNAAFYRYTGTPSDVASENDANGNRLATPFHAFLRMNGPNYSVLTLPDQNGGEVVGIESLRIDGITSAGIYSLDGKRLPTFQKGMNLIVLDDGTVQRVFVK